MDTSTDTGAPQLAGRREWIGLAVLALPILLLSLDLSVLFLALPHLSADIGATSTQQLWITDIYGFMVAGFLVTMGTVGDRIGRRKLLLIGAVAFGVASVLAAYSSTPEMLIATRALLGIAGATLAPSALALISNMFQEPKQQAVAIAVVMSCFMGGSALGPVVGGVLLEFFWWGSVFLLAVPVMLLLIVAGPSLLPEYRAPQGGKVDLLSVALSLAAVLTVIYGLKELAKGWAAVPGIVLVAGLVLGVVFVLRQRKLTHPLLDMRLFGNRTFSSALGILFFGGILLGGTTLLVTQYLQLVQGLSPLAAGLWLLPSIGTMVVGATLAPKLAVRFRPAYVIAGGMVIAAIGYIVITQVQSGGALAILVLGWAIALGGNGLPAGLGTGLVIGSAPPEKVGSASSISETSTEFGIALGLASLGTVGAAVYRSEMTTTMPAGVPPETAEAAQNSVNGALSAGQQLPELIAPARDAFAAGLNVAAGISAAGFLILAVVAAVMLRHIPSYGEMQAQAEAAGAPETDTTEADTPATADTEVKQ
jgi:DHA2 family multidrug resistance protein-like MFS transporter